MCLVRRKTQTFPFVIRMFPDIVMFVSGEHLDVWLMLTLHFLFVFYPELLTHDT